MYRTDNPDNTFFQRKFPITKKPSNSFRFKMFRALRHRVVKVSMVTLFTVLVSLDALSWYSQQHAVSRATNIFEKHALVQRAENIDPQVTLAEYRHSGYSDFLKFKQIIDFLTIRFFSTFRVNRRFVKLFDHNHLFDFSNYLIFPTIRFVELFDFFHLFDFVNYLLLSNSRLF